MEPTQLDRIEKQVTLLTTLLTGNGEPAKGLVIRVDRLEEWSKGIREWTGRIILFFVLSVLGTLSVLLIWGTPVHQLFGGKP